MKKFLRQVWKTDFCGFLAATHWYNNRIRLYTYRKGLASKKNLFREKNCTKTFFILWSHKSARTRILQKWQQETGRAICRIQNELLYRLKGLPRRCRTNSWNAFTSTYRPLLFRILTESTQLFLRDPPKSRSPNPCSSHFFNSARSRSDKDST